MNNNNILIICLIIIIIILISYNNKNNFENNWYEKIDGIVYINLENREDRKKLILKELTKIETDMTHVNKVSGVLMPKNGHKGCIQSHILALNIAKMNNWAQILIVEDDMELVVSPDEFNNSINHILDYMKSNNIKWDVIMLSTCFSKKTRITDTIVQIKAATTSSAYIINKHYYDKLINLFIDSNNNMVKHKMTDGNWEPYALDQQWQKLQATDNWYGFTNDLIKQRNISSSIQI